MGTDYCEECQDKNSCSIRNLELEDGCPKHELLHRQETLMAQLSVLSGDGSMYTSSEIENIARNAIIIINSMKKGWL